MGGGLANGCREGARERGAGALAKGSVGGAREGASCNSGRQCCAQAKMACYSYQNYATKVYMLHILLKATVPA